MNPPPPPVATASLPTVVSSLTSLLNLSTTTLKSLSIPTTTNTTTFLPCPYNPNHHLPPASLFSHHLSCPSPLSLLSPHYPHTLHSSTSPPSLPSTTSDLYFSLENYIGNNFFYRDCPAPVTPTTRQPPLILPRFLHLECADFGKDSELFEFPVNFIRFLPSEIWGIRSEIEAWNGSDVSFSIRILRAVLRLSVCELARLAEWIVARSPRYGVIIDFAMRDHVILLVKLCLKAIVREAIGLAGFLFGGEGVKTESSQRFDCPVIREVLLWLASQFGLLYGEVNGKFFAVDVVRECILDSALSASLFPLEEIKSDQERDNDEHKPVGINLWTVDCEENERKSLDRKTVGGSVISISQVAAAVAALHERSRIEETIRALREARPLSTYQRNMEHSYVSKIADEERRRRPDYRPIIEHDGLLWQHSRNKDTNKIKTRDELLAEERDYKRRRMSYRGKKSKRSTVEVMRDIIEEYMDDIKQFGGNGSTSKAVENSQVEHKHRHEELEDDLQHHRRDCSLDHEFHNSNRNVKMVKHDGDDYSVSRDGRRSGSHSREYHHKERRNSVEAHGEGSSRRSHRTGSKSREENYHKRERYECDYSNRKRDRDEDNREYWERRRSKIKRDDRERSEEEGRHSDRERKKTSRTISSRRERYNEFDDRYDPAESHDFDEDDA